MSEALPGATLKARTYISGLSYKCSCGALAPPPATLKGCRYIGHEIATLPATPLARSFGSSQ